MRKDGVVLVGVLKSKRDLGLLLKERWYRIPVADAPKRKFGYVAFYQPAAFGRRGKGIRYYARVLRRETLPRIVLLPKEPRHAGAGRPYIRIRVGKVRKLPRAIRNILPRRVSFGFTTLARLREAKTVLELYGVAATEEMIGKALRRAGIRATAQYYVKGEGRRYFLDFAVFCKRGKVAIECDNRKAHRGKRQREKDAAKDEFLHTHDWTVVRLTEAEIVGDVKGCVAKVRKAIRKLGGL